MWIQEGETGGLSDCIAERDAIRALRDVHGIGSPRAGQGAYPVPREKCRSGYRQRKRQMGRLAQHTGNARDAGTDQKKIGESAESDDYQDVLAPQALSQDEGVLGTDRDDECRAEGEPGCECRDWHAAERGPLARMNPVKLTVLT